MNMNFNIESQQFCYGFEDYEIKKINDKKYIIPVKNSKQVVKTVPEFVNESMIELLNIGKKLSFNEIVEDTEVLDYVKKYGLFGFMSDFSINRYYILDDTIVLRDYNFIENKDSISVIKLEDYLKTFMPKLTNKQITELIKNCRNKILPSIMEKYLTPELNKYLIFSNNYAEPIDMILQYAKLLYTGLVNVLNGRGLSSEYQILKINNLSNSLDHLTSDGLELKYNYLKQAIDLNYLIQICQDVILLKTCKFCNKAFIASSSKSEYDSPNCKNKSNVYSFRKRAQEEK